MLGLKLNHVGKRGPKCTHYWPYVRDSTMTFTNNGPVMGKGSPLHGIIMDTQQIDSGIHNSSHVHDLPNINCPLRSGKPGALEGLLINPRVLYLTRLTSRLFYLFLRRARVRDTRFCLISIGIHVINVCEFYNHLISVLGGPIHE